MNYTEILEKVNISSKDNGYFTTVADRRLAIVDIVKRHCPSYELFYDGRISLIFRHKNFEAALQKQRNLILISSHFDETYSVPCFHEQFDASIFKKNKLISQALRGTFDNSATNAALLCAMLSNELPKSALVVFEGNEEGNDENELSGMGVYEAMVVIKHYQAQWKQALSLALVLDVTGYKGGKNHYTLENYFVADSGEQRLRFRNEESLLREALTALPDTPSKHHNKADEDSAWTYDEHNVNTISLCLPLLFDGDEDFEDPRGQILLTDSGSIYTNAIIQLAKHFSSLSV